MSENYHITLKPVYSQTVPQPDGVKLSNNWSLSWHRDSPDKLWGRIDKDFDLFIFDEFHVFAAPQIAAVINTTLLILCINLCHSALVDFFICLKAKEIRYG